VETARALCITNYDITGGGGGSGSGWGREGSDSVTHAEMINAQQQQQRRD